MFPVTCAELDRRHVIMHQAVYLATLSVAQIVSSGRTINDLVSHLHGGAEEKLRPPSQDGQTSGRKRLNMEFYPLDSDGEPI